MSRARLTALAADLLWPLGAWAAVGALARAVGYDSLLYLRVSVALALFALPGWWLSLAFTRPEEGPLPRLLWAHGLGLVWLGLSAGACQLLGLSFDAWYGLHAAACAGALAFALLRAEAPPDPGPWLLRARAAPAALLVCGAALVFLAAYLRTPPSLDLEVMAPQMLEHQRRRDFAWVAPGAAAFGLDGVMPRLRSHLVHAGLALLADATRSDAVAVATWGATVHLGLLLVLALVGWTRALLGAAAPAWAALLALLLPLTVLYAPGRPVRPYEVWFQLLNGPAIDKAVALLLLLPFLLLVALRWLERGRGRELLLLLLAAPLLFLVHPLTPHYLLLAALPLALGVRAPLARRAALVAGALLAVVAVGALQGAGSDQAAIEALVRRDLQTHAWPHYWEGHYAACGRDTETIHHVDGAMRLRPGLYLTPFLVGSGLATLAWFGLRLRARRALAREEDRALRVQTAALLCLALTWAGANLLLVLWPQVWRGVERLHWAYLGFPALAGLLGRLAAALGPRLPARLPALRLAPALVVAAFLLGQVPWLLREPHEFMRRDGGPAESPGPWPLELARTWQRTAAGAWSHAHGQGELEPGRAPWDPPVWLRPEDRVYLQTGSDWPESPRGLGWQLALDRFALLPRLVHYPELGHEAWALERRRELFLSQWDAFHDGIEGRVSLRLRKWLARERVTLVISADPDFVAELARGMGREARLVDRDTWRLE